VVSHTFAEEGKYFVVLTVAESGCSNPQCEDTVSQTVTVSGDDLIFVDGFESGDTSAWVP
jgi:PKD repeat protein